MLVSASYDKTVKVWDFNSGVLLETLEGHRSGVMDVTFSPDGTMIASASYDSTIKIWEFLPLDKLIQKALEKCGTRQLTKKERKKYYLE